MLHLSAPDIRQLQTTLHVLDSPLESSDVDSWRMQVDRSVRALLKSDRSGFFFPVEGAEPVWSESIDPQASYDYLSYFMGRDPGHQNRLRLGLDVCSQRQIYGKGLERTELYNDFFRP